MMPGQKFEEIEQMCGTVEYWLEEVDSDSPYIAAAVEMLYSFTEMINGNREWETCNQVTDRIERMYPGADLHEWKNWR